MIHDSGLLFLGHPVYGMTEKGREKKFVNSLRKQ